jgi:hypothetical protein
MRSRHGVLMVIDLASGAAPKEGAGGRSAKTGLRVRLPEADEWRDCWTSQRCRDHLGGAVRNPALEPLDELVGEWALTLTDASCGSYE